MKYFKEFFNSPYAWRVIGNTLLINFWNLVFGFPLPIIFALMLNEVKNQLYKRTVQTITYAVFHFTGSCMRYCGIIVDFTASGGVFGTILNPVQWRCAGMEREGLKRDFGDKLIFHGGMDNQYTLPFGSQEEVKQEVIDNIRILGNGGGYILAPCHNIQAVSPAENIVAMYETGYKYGFN